MDSTRIFDWRMGDSKKIIQEIPDEFIHSIVTDPPYEINFMQKDWDASGISYDVRFWKECYRVLKPGGYLLAFSSASTYHRLATAIEDAGFVIRDKIDYFYPIAQDWELFYESLSTEQQRALDHFFSQEQELGIWSWIYGQGMPKGQNIEKIRQKQEVSGIDIGYHTSLKPANEPICLARKPLSEKTVLENLQRHHTGALHVDPCRISRQQNDRFSYGVTGNQKATTGDYGIYGHYNATPYIPHKEGRFPSNVVIDEQLGFLLDQQSTLEPSNQKNKKVAGASRFYFQSKAKKEERSWKEQLFRLSTKASINQTKRWEEQWGREFVPEGELTEEWQSMIEPIEEWVLIRNEHPTIKPMDLIRYLIRLVTPSDGIVLDPFLGSGTTMIACAIEDVSCIGIEKEENYFKMAQRRWKAYKKTLKE